MILTCKTAHVENVLFIIFLGKFQGHLSFVFHLRTALNFSELLFCFKTFLSCLEFRLISTLLILRKIVHTVKYLIL